jgi:hypothetical protein
LNGIRIQIIIQTIYLKLFAKANNYLGLNISRGSPSAAPQPFFPSTGCTPTFSAHSPPTGPPSRPSQPAGHSTSSYDPQAPPVSGACGSFFLLLPYTPMHASRCARGLERHARRAVRAPQLRPQMLVQGEIAPFAPVPRHRTLGAGRRMPATLPPWPGRRGWPRGKAAHAPCLPPLHKKAARTLPRGRRHPPAQPHLGDFFFALQLNQRSKERKSRGRREEGERKRAAGRHHVDAQGRVVNHGATARSRGRRCPGAPRRSRGR